MGLQVRLAAAVGVLVCSTAAAADWNLSLGPGVQSMPGYPGSRHLHTFAFPFIDAEYADRLYTNGSDLIGLYAYKTPDTQIGSAIEYDLNERLPEVKRTERFKLFANQTVSFITVDGNIASDVAGRHEGTVAQANLWASAPLGPAVLLSVGPGVSWGDQQYMRTFFRTQAGGLSDTHLNGFVQWRISSRYQFGLLACAAHLRGNALQSPLTQQHEQTTLTGWIAYRFK